MRISKYIYSIIFLLPLVLKGQDSTQFIRSVTLNADLMAPAMQFFEEGRKAYSAGMDLQLGESIYVGAQLGIQDIEKDYNFLDYESTGAFWKFCFKYNILKRKDDDKKSIGFLSLRSGYAILKQKTGNITILGNDFPSQAFNLKDETLNTFWIEFGGGIRASLIKNLMMGWNIHGRIRLKDPGYELVPPVYIPGFGDGSKKFNMGFEYTISYIIPFVKM